MAKAQNIPADVAGAAAKAAREALYVGVGLGVLGFQRAQVQRHELQRRLAGSPAFEAGFNGARQVLATGREQLEGLVKEATRAAEQTVGPLDEQLPKVAREVTQRAQQGARQLGGQVRKIVSRD